MSAIEGINYTGIALIVSAVCAPIVVFMQWYMAKKLELVHKNTNSLVAQQIEAAKREATETERARGEKVAADVAKAVVAKANEPLTIQLPQRRDVAGDV